MRIQLTGNWLKPNSNILKHNYIFKTMRTIKFLFFTLIIMNFFSACGHKKTNSPGGVSETIALQEQNFIDAINGKATNLYFLNNKEGMSAAITNYGGRIVSLTVPDKNGNMTDVVVGFQSLKDFINSTEPYFGALIGRVGNPIAKGMFSIEGEFYTLDINNAPNALHGGKPGFQDVVWDAVQLDDATLQLSYFSEDGEAGFPGNLNVKVTYAIEPGNELTISYEAFTDKKTVVNLTNHAFFNLNGEGSGTILNHMLQINADAFTPVDDTLIPSGKIVAVEGTPFDFLQPVAIGARIEADDVQLHHGKGYDHNYVLNAPVDGNMRHAATVTGDQSGIVMDVFTVEPGLQFYSGNFMQGKNTFKSGEKDDFRTAFCLETQHFPDSPNQKTFPSILIEPGETYQTCSIYKFSVKK